MTSPLTLQRRRWFSPTLSLATVSLTLALDASTVRAVDCASLPNPIFGRGGSAPTLLFRRVGAELSAISEPITVIYSDPGACKAMDSLVSGEKLFGGTAKYWTKNGDQIVDNTCDLPTSADQGIEVQWGSMAQLATTCPGVDALPATVGDYIGPISGFDLFVPTASTQQAISAEAVYYIYGFGVEDPGAQVAPWTVPGAVASRKTTSAAGLLLAKAVGIPLSHTLAGDDVKTNQGAVEWITKDSPAAVANPEAAIGFASTETAQENRDRVRTLAFKAVGQDYAYWPDSTASALDKINIREGRYFLWNPHHIFAKLDGQGEIADANVKRFVDYVTSKVEIPDGVSYLDLQIENGNIPDCAMHVTRDGDVGPLASYQPDEPCGCYFDFKATGETSCKACEENSDCSGSEPVCRHGYCEEK